MSWAAPAVLTPAKDCTGETEEKRDCENAGDSFLVRVDIVITVILEIIVAITIIAVTGKYNGNENCLV